MDRRRLKSYVAKSQRVGAIGIEALAAIRQVGIEPQYRYGVTEAIIESAQCGLSFTVACTDDALLDLIRRLEEENLYYDMIDLARTTK